MAQINKPSDYFNTILWTGDGTDDRSISGVGFQPDWVWLKQRNGTNYHTSFDVVRGATKRIFPNASEAEDTNADSLQTFETDGFQVGTNGGVNGTGNTFASWNWLAGGTAVSNTDGSITSSVSASITSGFSIVSWSGSGATGTIGHGLGTEPSVIIPKCRTQTADWYSYWKPLGNGNAVRLNTTDASAATGIWNSTSPTSSVFSVINNTVVNQSGHTYVAYCFAEKQGFSKFGSYTGNGNADGTFVYTGFKPAFVIQKNTSATQGWQLQDNKRLGYNGANKLLQPHDSAAESDVNRIDMLSNGFKVRTTDAGQNSSGQSYIYMAFAEQPLVGTNNIPATAR